MTSVTFLPTIPFGGDRDEQLALTQRVQGSSPSALTNIFKDLAEELVPAAKLVAAARFSLPRRSCL